MRYCDYGRLQNRWMRYQRVFQVEVAVDDRLCPLQRGLQPAIEPRERVVKPEEIEEVIDNLGEMEVNVVSKDGDNVRVFCA